MSHPLAAAGRLSRSPLWRLQRSFFDRQGIRAWTEGTVPHYVTSNPWIADAYAKVVFGWLRDCATPAWPAMPGGEGFAPIDRAQPVHVIELGCGPGRFGYLFLRRLLDRLSRSALHDVRVRYVLTDFTDSNLDPLRSQPALQPLVQSGALDFARFDIGEDRELRLSHSGEVLRPGRLANPLAVIANYVLDSVPQDCFEVCGGRLYEHLAAVSATESEPDFDDPTLLERVEVSYRRRAAVGDPYGDPDLDHILDEYREHLGNATFLFPTAALRCLRHLGRLAGGRLLLLSADKGSSREEMLRRHRPPALTLHGSFSLPVNHHAIGRYFLHREGICLHTSRQGSDLDVIACLLGTPPGGTAETRLAFEDAVERAGPDDFFAVKKGIEASYESFTLGQLLAWLRLSGWDSNILLGCWPTLRDLVPTASPEELRELRETAHRVWETHFPLRERRDLAFQLGVLLCETGEWADALAFFDRSEDLHGPNPATAYNQALCRWRLGEREAALERLDAALAGEPAFADAAALRAEVLAADAETPPAGRRTAASP